ncbi:RING finger and SPRY domain-containing protein 1 [Nymphon striatum]|nr:RING finger and SPRY domain-containing protein 1 [Nymphon striatum]
MIRLHFTGLAYSSLRKLYKNVFNQESYFYYTSRTVWLLFVRKLFYSKVIAMGSCVCKDDDDDENSNETGVPTAHDSSFSRSASTENLQQNSKDMLLINKLVLETLAVIRTLVDNDQDPPPSMAKLNLIADKESGWLAVVQSVVHVIPMEDALGLAVITLLLDSCPLPTRETVCKISEIFELPVNSSTTLNSTEHRNLCVVLGCIAEKLAGPSSIALLNEDTLNYLLSNLDEESHPSVILFSLIALEKFAQTSENKMAINNKLSIYGKKNPLLILEDWFYSDVYIKRQVGFCASYCLDNLCNYITGKSYFFTFNHDRLFSYEVVNRTGLNAMLNSNDVSEYLKISADGLQARCDATSFESVRCTFQVDTGIWYYEEGYGIGDDEFSVAYDGCRQLIWHKAISYPHNHSCWKPGDVLGSLLDLTNYQIIFYLNGNPLKAYNDVFNYAKSRFFVAASFMSFQQCEFNFGHTPFKFAPANIPFQCINDVATLSEEEKIILPRHKKLEKLRQSSVKEGSCNLCFDNCANVVLEPCQHNGFCYSCALQLDSCPMCRRRIERIINLNVIS